MNGLMGPVAFTVDATSPTCRGAIAALEPRMRLLPRGSVVRVIVLNVPNFIDISAWADRKGHRVVLTSRDGNRYDMLVEKEGLLPPGAMAESSAPLAPQGPST